MSALRRLSSPSRLPALISALLPALLLGCGDRKEDSGAEGTLPDPTGAACAQDSECGDGTICEADECVPGDRSNAPEEAVGIFMRRTTPA